MTYALVLLLVFSICLSFCAERKSQIRDTLTEIWPLDGLEEEGSEQAIWEQLRNRWNGSKYVRPVKKQNDTVIVEIAPILTAVVSLDEVDERITLSLTFGMRWNNQYITWNPNNSVQFITIPCTLLWMPRITTETTLDLLEIPDWETEQCRVSHNGDVSVYRNQIQTSICRLHIFKFPFDSQTCSLEYTAWGYDDTQVSLARMQRLDGAGEVNIRSKLLQHIPEWYIGDYKPSEHETETPDGEPVTYLSYKLTIRRKSLHYLVNIIIPSFIICTLSLIGLFSPSEGTAQVRNEKISMGLTCLLTMSVMLLVVSEDVPKTNVGCMLGHYVIFEFLLATFATVVATKMVYLNKFLDRDKVLPRWVKLLACSRKRRDENVRITEHETNFSLLRQKLSQGQKSGKNIANGDIGKIKILDEKKNSGKNSKDFENYTKSYDETRKIARIYKNRPILMLLDQCLKHIVYMRQVTEQEKKDEKEQLLRSKILCKLEHNLLILFLVLNIIVSIAWFIVGYLN